MSGDLAFQSCPLLSFEIFSFEHIFIESRAQLYCTTLGSAIHVVLWGAVHVEYNVSGAPWSSRMWDVLIGYPSNLCVVVASDCNHHAHK